MKNNLRILDCTLRDGGYINDFDFGRRNIEKILSKLQTAGIDIVECGFLEDGEYDPDSSVFTSVEQIADLLPKKRNEGTMFVAMACYGEYDISQLSPCDGTSVTGIRVTFHYNEVAEALEYCRAIKELGYKVFVQPVGTTSYSDEQLLDLIHKVNELKPYAFYLVDTLGLMVQKDVARFFYLIDHNLDKEIHMGFHSHNNLQLSFSNCQYLASIDTDRIISLDSSIYGMGRGAGNLNTELIANYLNSYCHAHYRIEPLLEIVDEIISKIREKYEWGYNVVYYLAAINGCHPNYAAHLSGKRTLTIKEISSILRMIEPDRRSLFNKTLAEEKYLEYQSAEIDDTHSVEILGKEINGKRILIVGPGNSINEYKHKLRDLAEEADVISISVGFVSDFLTPDFVFISNLRRYHTTFNPEGQSLRLIHTSNVKVDEVEAYPVNYSTLLDEDPVIADNSLIMLLNLLHRLDAKEILLAGFDGYKEDSSNYYQQRLELPKEISVNASLNASMTRRLSQLTDGMNIQYVTPSIYSANAAL